MLADEIKHLSIPQYETLAIKKIKEFIVEHDECLKYLPDECEWDKLPKQWFCNVIHTTVDKEFAAWVK